LKEIFIEGNIYSEGNIYFKEILVVFEEIFIGDICTLEMFTFEIFISEICITCEIFIISKYLFLENIFIGEIFIFHMDNGIGVRIFVGPVLVKLSKTY
jgi:hypothetical protein